ncbi:DUF3472 domain-containing protein [Bartonella doshiae]|uniref:Domain of uncharacterized function (DUF3472) n=2 Tax=Bartonella doshiae TaxID=33044 RepID=A0A380ZEX8_BARDO|nr:DUF3472 domain-containing protein [Bartonella doshiae]EJF79983.1 hypothetical protein MCS_01278 [Bartonella doshiae NCTC 12862 = ATCC 700133]MBB6158942.1 hypothetical protein [Bartonella doshiae]SUV45519.1 Domain of uncharacterised function (DUF3472) [Bartonella doshiae]
MYRYVKKILLILLLLLLSKPSYAVFAGKVITIKHDWSHNRSFDQFSFFQQITHDGGPDSIYFWANQFQFENGKTGYIGLFNRGARTIHFSITNATGWKSGKCKHFTQEGSGVRCELEFPWKVGRRYQLNVSKNENLITGTIIDLITKKTMTVGVIEVSSTFGKFQQSSSFVEDHSRWKRHLSSCYVLSPQSSIFFSPIADNKYQALIDAYAEGNCNDPYVVQILCKLSTCINSISDLGGIASPDVPGITITNGKDLPAKTLSDALKKNELIAIRLHDGSWTPKIFLPSPSIFKWKSIFVENRATLSSSIYNANNTQKLNTDQQIMYMSDGKIWKIMKETK